MARKAPGVNEPLLKEAAKTKLHPAFIRPESTVGEVLDAQFQLVSEEPASAAIGRILELNKIESEDNSQTISPQILNAQFKDQLIEPFTAPTKIGVAQEIVERHLNRRRLQTIIDDGPQGIAMGTGKFAIGILPFAMDPIELLAGFAGGAIFNLGRRGLAGYRMSTSARVGTRAVEVGVVGGRRLKNLRDTATSFMAERTLLRDFGEGVVGNMLVEPVSGFATSQENLEFTLGDALANATYGAIAFSGVKYGINRGVGLIRNRGFKQASAIDELANNQFNADQTVDVKAAADEVIRRNYETVQNADIRAKVLSEEYEKARAEGLSESDAEFRARRAAHRGIFNIPPHKKEMFGAFINENVLDESSNLVIGDDRGGVTITDNPGLANLTGAGFGDSSAKVVLVRLKEGVKLRKLSDPLPTDVFNKVIPVLKKAKVPIRSARGRSAKEIYDTIDDNIGKHDLSEGLIKEFNDALESAGVKGFHAIQDRVAGQSVPANHVAHVFDHTNLEAGKSFDVDPSAVRTPTAKEFEDTVRAANAPERAFYYDADSQKKFDEIDSAEFRDLNRADLANIEKSADAALDALDDQKILNEADKRTIKEVRQSKVNHENVGSILQAALGCLRK